MTYRTIFQLYFFSLNFLSGITSKCQTAPIQIMLAVLSGMLVVKYACKNHQQTTNFKVDICKRLIYNKSPFRINPVESIERTVPLKLGLECLQFNSQRMALPFCFKINDNRLATMAR